MNQWKHKIDDAIGAAPSSRIDVDEIIARQRRLTTMRRWSGAGGVATMVVGIGVVSALLGGPVGPSGGGALDFDPFAKDLEKALRTSMTEQLPDAEFLEDESSATGLPFRFRPMDPRKYPAESPGRYRSEFDVKTASGRGSFTIEVARGLTLPSSCDDESPHQDELAPYRASCDADTGPHGEKIVAISYAESRDRVDDPKSHRSNMVYVSKRDGTGIWMWARSVYFTGDPADDKGRRPTATEPPLSPRQLTEIAVDPDLTIDKDAARLPTAEPDESPKSGYDPEVAERLANAYRKAVERELPDTEFTASFDGRKGEPFQFTGEAGNYMAHFDTEDPAGTGSVSIVVAPENKVRPPDTCEEAATHGAIRDGLTGHIVLCGVTRGDDGESVMSVTADSRDRRDGASGALFKAHFVFVTKGDGTMVAIWARNLDTSGPRGSGSDGAAEPTASRVPMSIPQLQRVALAKGLTLGD